MTQAALAERLPGWSWYSFPGFYSKRKKKKCLRVGGRVRGRVVRESHLPPHASSDHRTGVRDIMSAKIVRRMGGGGEGRGRDGMEPTMHNTGCCIHHKREHFV